MKPSSETPLGSYSGRPDGGRFFYYANGVEDFSLGLPPLRLPQVRPSQEDLNRKAVPEKSGGRRRSSVAAKMERPYLLQRRRKFPDQTERHQRLPATQVIQTDIAPPSWWNNGRREIISVRRKAAGDTIG